MYYADDRIYLLQKIYRHKIVHLSQPKSAMLTNGVLLTWETHHDNRSKHLGIKRLPGVRQGQIPWQGKFIVSIRSLQDDIKESVTRTPKGYLEDLKYDVDLQKKFLLAINQIYDPLLTD